MLSMPAHGKYEVLFSEALIYQHVSVPPFSFSPLISKWVLRIA
jgi:hypothetical protein